MPILCQRVPGTNPETAVANVARPRVSSLAWSQIVHDTDEREWTRITEINPFGRYSCLSVFIRVKDFMLSALRLQARDDFLGDDFDLLRLVAIGHEDDAIDADIDMRL